MHMQSYFNPLYDVLLDESDRVTGLTEREGEGRGRGRTKEIVGMFGKQFERMK